MGYCNYPVPFAIFYVIKRLFYRKIALRLQHTILGFAYLSSSKYRAV